jgi:hypothetical protein
MVTNDRLTEISGVPAYNPIRDGGSVLVMTPEQAGEILKAIRHSNLKQLRGQRPRPQAKPTA